MGVGRDRDSQREGSQYRGQLLDSTCADGGGRRLIVLRVGSTTLRAIALRVDRCLDCDDLVWQRQSAFVVPRLPEPGMLVSALHAQTRLHAMLPVALLARGTCDGTRQAGSRMD